MPSVSVMVCFESGIDEKCGHIIRFQIAHAGEVVDDVVSSLQFDARSANVVSHRKLAIYWARIVTAAGVWGCSSIGFSFSIVANFERLNIVVFDKSIDGSAKLQEV